MGQAYLSGESRAIEAVTIDTRTTSGGLAVALIALPGGPVAAARAPELLVEVAAAVETCAADPAVGAIVISGPGAIIACAAAAREPLPEMDAIDATAYALCGQEGLAAIVDCRLPVIAAIEGSWVDARFEIALACDVRIAARGASVGLPDVSAAAGGTCFGGLTRLTRLIGPGRAKWVALAGQPLTASAAWEAGIVEELTQPGEALQCALAFAGRVASAAPSGVAAAKATVNRAAGEMETAEALRWEAAVFGQSVEDGEARAWGKSRNPKGAASGEGGGG